MLEINKHKIEKLKKKQDFERQNFKTNVVTSMLDLPSEVDTFSAEIKRIKIGYKN